MTSGGTLPAGIASDEQALEELREVYSQGNLVVFAGADISTAAGLPSWAGVVKTLANHPRIGQVPERREEMLALLQGRKPVDALTVAERVLGRLEFASLVEHSLNDQDLPVPPLAKAIAALAPRLKAVLTTNIDHTLEHAFSGRWPSIWTAPPGILQRRGFILKLHGTLLDRSSWVFTRADYDHATWGHGRTREVLAQFFQSFPVLFVGHDLESEELESVLSQVRALAGDHPPRNFALVPSGAVQGLRREKLESAGVRLIEYANPDGQHGEASHFLAALAGTPQAADPAVISSATGLASPPATQRFQRFRPWMAGLLLIALAGLASLLWWQTAESSTGDHVDSPVRAMTMDSQAVAVGPGSQPEQVGPVKPQVPPGVGLPLKVEGRELSLEPSQQPEATGSGSRESGARGNHDGNQPAQGARRKPRTPGSGSHPEQPRVDQQVANVATGSAALQVPEKIAPAQDENHNQRPPGPVFYGTIKDDGTGEAYGGVEVQLVGTSCVTRTDEYGNFTLKECDPDRVYLLKNPTIRVRMPGATGWCNDIPLLPPPSITSVSIQVSCEGAKFGSQPGGQPGGQFSARGSIRAQGTKLQGTAVASVQLGDVDLMGSTLRGITGDTRFVGKLSDETPVELVVTGSELDAADPTGETVLYSVIMKRSGSDEWESVCSPDRLQGRRAIAVAGIWDATGAHIEKAGSFTFACMSGVIAKCVHWGYRPWQQINGTSLKDHHQACTRMARADYCGNGASHTREGTVVQMFDSLMGREEAPAQGMQFEAAWTVDGATCIRRTRWHEPTTVGVGSQPSASGCEERLRELSSGSGDMEDSSCRMNPVGGAGHPALLWNYSYVDVSTP